MVGPGASTALHLRRPGPRPDRPSEPVPTPARRSRRRGSTMVEFVIVSSFLFVMLFGIIEFGMAFRDRLNLVTAVRNGAREAATGATLAKTRAIVRNTANVAVADAQIALEYNTVVDGTGSWVAAADNSGGTANNVPIGFLLRVRTVNWQHQMVTGSFFAWLSGVQQGRLSLAANVVMRRE